MLQQLSWAQYLTAITIITIAYYVYVLVVYYKVELQRLFNGNGNTQQSLSLQGLMPPKAVVNYTEDQGADLFSLGHQLMATLQPIIAKAADAKSPREELLFGLQQVIRNGYQHLKATSVQTTIHKYIQEQCTQQLQILLSEDDLQQLWV